MRSLLTTPALGMPAGFEIDDFAYVDPPPEADRIAEDVRSGRLNPVSPTKRCRVFFDVMIPLERALDRCAARAGRAPKPWPFIKAARQSTPSTAAPLLPFELPAGIRAYEPPDINKITQMHQLQADGYTNEEISLTLDVEAPLVRHFLGNGKRL